LTSDSTDCYVYPASYDESVII